MQEIYEIIKKMEIPSEYRVFGAVKAVTIFDFQFIYETVIPQYTKHLIENRQTNIINLSSMKYFSFLASFGKLAYLDLSNKPL